MVCLPFTYAARMYPSSSENVCHLRSASRSSGPHSAVHCASACFWRLCLKCSRCLFALGFFASASAVYRVVSGACPELIEEPNCINNPDLLNQCIGSALRFFRNGLNVCCHRKASDTRASAETIAGVLRSGAVGSVPGPIAVTVPIGV